MYRNVKKTLNSEEKREDHHWFNNSKLFNLRITIKNNQKVKKGINQEKEEGVR